MHNIFDQRHLAEARFFAIALTFCGGFTDAFTYIQFNHTLAAAQTGNIVFLSAALASHNFFGVFDRLASLIAYIVGLAIVSIFHAHIDHYWRVFCLILILIIGMIVGGAFQPTSVSRHYRLVWPCRMPLLPRLRGLATATSSPAATSRNRSWPGASTASTTTKASARLPSITA